MSTPNLRAALSPGPRATKERALVDKEEATELNIIDFEIGSSPWGRLTSQAPAQQVLDQHPGDSDDAPGKCSIESCIHENKFPLNVRNKFEGTKSQTQRLLMN